ncbi:MAG: SH3 domain-containing protein [Pseudomonadota bacterium]
MAPRICAVIFGVFLMMVGMSAHGQDVEPKISHISGKPVPRYETLRYSAAHGRTGPTTDHPIVWRYERVGLPMLIVKETPGWRRVRDPDGAEVWMASRMLTDGSTALLRQEVALRRAARDDAPAVARAAAGVLVDVQRLDGDWVKIAAAGRRGWAPASSLWGVDLAPPESAS